MTRKLMISIVAMCFLIGCKTARIQTHTTYTATGLAISVTQDWDTTWHGNDFVGFSISITPTTAGAYSFVGSATRYRKSDLVTDEWEYTIDGDRRTRVRALLGDWKQHRKFSTYYLLVVHSVVDGQLYRKSIKIYRVRPSNGTFWRAGKFRRP